MLYAERVLSNEDAALFGDFAAIEKTKEAVQHNDVVRHKHLLRSRKEASYEDANISCPSNIKEVNQQDKMIPPQQLLEGKVTVEITSHADTAYQEWSRLSPLLQKVENHVSNVHIDHVNQITPADVVAVARHGSLVEVEDEDAATKRVSTSVDALRNRLVEGNSLYGITTGFGGSANTRTQKTFDLQRALLQHQQAGILPVTKSPGSIYSHLKSSPNMTSMPENWVRGAMLIRLKSLLNGHSAIRWEIISVLMAMLNKNIIPLVPLRGSISASGDLSPLSYIAGAIAGNPEIFVWTTSCSGDRVLLASDIALREAGLTSQQFGPKEGLAVLNGTAFSTAVGALALHDTHNLALLSQLLTAMGVEALSGTVGSFSPFFAQVRPHTGQAEAASTILAMLSGSCLARNEDEAEDSAQELKQDRYALRTASQWIGPVIEDLLLAHKQVGVECNSTTDNPLFNVQDGTIHHGGNFQALSITSAMEKTRQGLQLLGRMLFSQCTELMNPATNNGLPPNLAADEPSTSYTFKGCDINIAAYMSELAFLANPVSTHVQTAEMGNQALNSLALVSARYTHQAVELVMQICAVYIYAACQALDLRAMDAMFRKNVTEEIHTLTDEAFEYLLPDAVDRKTLAGKLDRFVMKKLCDTTSLDSEDRFQQIAEAAQSVILTYLTASTTSTDSIPSKKPNINKDTPILDTLTEFTTRISYRLHLIFTNNRDGYFEHPDATPYLGKGSKKMYHFMRHVLKVPFHKGLADDPSRENGTLTVGGNVSVVFESMMAGGMWEVLVGLVKDLKSDGGMGEDEKVEVKNGDADSDTTVTG